MTTQPKAFEALTELEQNKQASAAWRNAASNKTVLHRLLLSAAWLGMPSDSENIESRNVACLKNFLEECAKVHKAYLPKLRGYICANFPYTITKKGDLKFSVAAWEAMGKDRQLVMDACTGVAGTWWDYKVEKESTAPKTARERLVQLQSTVAKLVKSGDLPEQESAAVDAALEGFDNKAGQKDKPLAELLEEVVGIANKRRLDDKEQALVAAVITALAAAR